MLTKYKYLVATLCALTFCLCFGVNVNAKDVARETTTYHKNYNYSQMVDFDKEKSFDYCFNSSCLINKSSNRLIYKFCFDAGVPKSDDDKVYLFEIASFEEENELNIKEPVSSSSKCKEMIFALPFEKRFLFEKFVPALLCEGEYIPLSYGQYVSNPEALALNNGKYLEIDSKKGLLLDANTVGTTDLDDLNVRRVVYNIPLSYVIGESNNREYPTINYEYNGKIYKFNGYKLAGFDYMFSYLTGQGYHITAIILNDYNKEVPELIHPKSRARTGQSMYYAFNTEEEEGVRLLEAVASFLAYRYSMNDYGMVYDWIIANEANQQKIWNYMATDDLDYYTQSFEKSFRTFYNAIKSNYSKAHVYFSIDHDWNNNYGDNSRFFNGRDFVSTFNDFAKRHGNYDWGLAIHPYPKPLNRTRFWTGKFDKTENSPVVTPMNLSTVTDILEKSDFRTNDGDVRRLTVSELGFSSRAGEKMQAAAFAYCYYIINDNKYIDAFLLNRQTDDRESLKSGLALGIYNNDYSSKYIADVFRNIDTEEGQKYIYELIDILDEDSLEFALRKAR